MLHADSRQAATVMRGMRPSEPTGRALNLPTTQLTFVLVWVPIMAVVLAALYLVITDRPVQPLIDAVEGLVGVFWKLIAVERAAWAVRRATEWKPEQIARAAVIATAAPDTVIRSGPPEASVMQDTTEDAPPPRKRSPRAIAQEMVEDAAVVERFVSRQPTRRRTPSKPPTPVRHRPDDDPTEAV